jgi:hypothetical protein
MIGNDPPASVAKYIADKEEFHGRATVVPQEDGRKEEYGGVNIHYIAVPRRPAKFGNSRKPPPGNLVYMSGETITMKRSFLAVFAAGALVAIVVWAQSTSTTTPTPPTIAQQVAQRVAQLTTLLDLTSGQQTIATGIFTTELTSLAALNTSQQAAETALQTAITSDDATGITAAANTIGGLATQQAQVEGTGEAAFYEILTTTQQAKYTVLGAGNGPGAPGGQNGPPGHPGAPGASGASGYSGNPGPGGPH